MIDEVETYWLTHQFDAISMQGAYTKNPVELYKFSLGEQALIPFDDSGSKQIRGMP